jgi:peptidoglycan/LPS O-acetylase OafA/YrhL
MKVGVLESSCSNYIPTLDGWRAVAILLVLFGHSVFMTFRPYGWTMVGAHGVEIFFVLSGYLITGKLLEGASLSTFYIRRAFRILPVLFTYLFTICTLGFALHRIPLLKSEVISSGFFIRNYFVYFSATATGVGGFTGHLWSLSIEEQFYLLWPLVLMCVGKGKPRRQLFAALVLFSFWTAVFVAVHVARVFHLFGWLWIPNLNYAGLVIGCALRITLSDVRASAVFRRIFIGRSALFVIVLLAYIVAFHRRVTMIDPLICGLGVCSTLIEPNRIVGRLLELRVLRWIGRLSYSLYIWQQLFIGYGEHFRAFGFFCEFPINLISLFAVSCGSYYLLEKPLMRLGHRLTKERPPHTPMRLFEPIPARIEQKSAQELSVPACDASQS